MHQLDSLFSDSILVEILVVLDFELQDVAKSMQDRGISEVC